MVISQTALQKIIAISKQGSIGAQEVYIFEFGAAVFWGFPKGDETIFLDYLKEFVTNGLLVQAEFEEGEDDIGERSPSLLPSLSLRLMPSPCSMLYSVAE